MICDSFTCPPSKAWCQSRPDPSSAVVPGDGTRTPSRSCPHGVAEVVQCRGLHGGFEPTVECGEIIRSLDCQANGLGDRIRKPKTDDLQYVGAPCPEFALDLTLPLPAENDLRLFHLPALQSSLPVDQGAGQLGKDQ